MLRPKGKGAAETTGFGTGPINFKPGSQISAGTMRLPSKE